jgi:hypothetical protein
MHENVVTPAQLELAEKLLPLCKGFYLAGGTGLALQMGHRRSVDFDLASYDPINSLGIERMLINKGFKIQSVLTATGDELSVIINGVKVTFFFFPFSVPHPNNWKRCQITLPGLAEIGAMKAYALGRRNMWKDYIDLYFLLKFKLTIGDLIARAKIIFENNFNSKLFREQLCYFDDIDCSESIDFMDVAPHDKDVQEFLEAIAVRI